MQRSTYTVCHSTDVLRAIRILARVLQVIQILVPVIIIVMAIIKFTKVIFDDDAKAVQEAVRNLFSKFFIGVCIAFIPLIVNTVMDLAGASEKTSMDFADCGRCLTSVKDCNELLNKYPNNNNVIP